MRLLTVEGRLSTRVLPQLAFSVFIFCVRDLTAATHLCDPTKSKPEAI
jgi:hypothetical protein